MKDNDIINVSAVCEMLDISRPTLEKAIKEGSIPALRVGAHWRFSKEAIEQKIKGE